MKQDLFQELLHEAHEVYSSTDALQQSTPCADHDGRTNFNLCLMARCRHGRASIDGSQIALVPSHDRCMAWLSPLQS